MTTVNLLGTPLHGPTFAVAHAECLGTDDVHLICSILGDKRDHHVPLAVISEDSEVVRIGDRGALLVLKTYAEDRGWSAPTPRRR